jgi:hypothetical protein
LSRPKSYSLGLDWVAFAQRGAVSRPDSVAVRLGRRSDGRERQCGRAR